MAAPMRKAHTLVVVDGDDVKVGAPMVSGASIEVKVIKHGKGDKVRIQKFKRNGDVPEDKLSVFVPAGDFAPGGDPTLRLRHYDPVKGGGGGEGGDDD